MRHKPVVALCVLAGLAALEASCGSPAPPPAARPAASSQPSTAAVPSKPAGYDPARDPAVDLTASIAAATKTRKRILVEVGGEWCVWCHIMHQYYEDHPELATYRDEHFVTLQVNFSEENENKAFLSQYPKIPGYPHLFVLESDGRLLVSQGTSELEEGRSYDLDKFTTFLKRWGTAL